VDHKNVAKNLATVVSPSLPLFLYAIILIIKVSSLKISSREKCESVAGGVTEKFLFIKFDKQTCFLFCSKPAGHYVNKIAGNMGKFM